MKESRLVAKLAKVVRLWGPWMDVVALALWGILFLKYWITEKLYLLIHPNYLGLTVSAGVALVAIAILRSWVLWRQRRQRRVSDTQHVALFPPGWGSTLLIGAAIVGLIVSPRAFASETAVQRGVNDATVTLTRVKPQAFRTNVDSEARSIVDWVRTLTVYPEPDAYVGQKAKVQGFVIYPPNLPQDYLLISRFVITCCAADVYPVSLPVKLSGDRAAYKPDTWLEVEGQMMTAELEGKRQLAIAASSLKPISEPKNPYDY